MLFRSVAVSNRLRDRWSDRIDQVIRSRHYTRLAGGLAGAPPDAALLELTTDIMHICERQGISWSKLLEQSRERFQQEEQAAGQSS